MSVILSWFKARYEFVCIMCGERFATGEWCAYLEDKQTCCKNCGDSIEEGE